MNAMPAPEFNVRSSRESRIRDLEEEIKDLEAYAEDLRACIARLRMGAQFERVYDDDVHGLDPATAAERIIRKEKRGIRLAELLERVDRGGARTSATPRNKGIQNGISHSISVGKRLVCPDLGSEPIRRYVAEKHGKLLVYTPELLEKEKG